jgi:hypothetical protein
LKALEVSTVCTEMETQEGFKGNTKMMIKEVHPPTTIPKMKKSSTKAVLREVFMGIIIGL